MNKILLSISLTTSVLVGKAQVVFNEVYPSPSNSNNEFFELYNTSGSSTPLSLDNYTIVTYFRISGKEGFYVMDLPNLSIAPKGYFVGASAIPYNYQNITNSTAADFSWNDPMLPSDNGYVKMWLEQSGSSGDGNPDYNEGTIPSDLNDFFVPHNGSGATYTIFLYRNGVLINALIFGTGGYDTVIPEIVSMPPLFVDMSGSAPDFTIDFSGYASVPVEKVNQTTGTDNGFVRTADGVCASWDKSSNKVSYSPKLTNGAADAYSGSISVDAIIEKGTAATGSKIVYDVIAAPSTSFPVTMDVYEDVGSTGLRLDAGDTYIESNTENVVTDGPFTTLFTPYDASMLVVVKSNAGCIDKVLFSPNIAVLPIKLVYFQGAMENNKAVLQWKVAQNEAVDRFEVERSEDGINFVTAGIVFPNAKSESENYSYNETKNNNKTYYRLKMYDKNQTTKYSSAIVLEKLSVNSGSLAIVNNPATDKLTLSYSSIANQSVEIKIYDLAGRIHMKQKTNVSLGTNFISLALNSAFTVGTYVVEVRDASQRQTAKFLKQ
ncbi:MAG TPA: T9SS type A sorting domain-containing protein [Chitinophagaceae bacterium]|jgi:type IX secretion system substrate protein|nr:T9SS type A sorting domain-containing protein [Chitinophagaceae bacterium]